MKPRKRSRLRRIVSAIYWRVFGGRVGGWIVTAMTRSPVKLYVKPGHFYSPIVDPVEAGRHLAALAALPTPASLPTSPSTVR